MIPYHGNQIIPDTKYTNTIFLKWIYCYIKIIPKKNCNMGKNGFKRCITLVGI